jgi:ATP-binding cassette subfamily F protein 3
MDVEQAIKALQSPIQRPPGLAMRLKTTLRSGNLVLRTTAMEIGFPGTTLFHAEPIQLERQECAALIGPNGTGKTTFLRTLMGQLNPVAGKVTFGASLKVGYFAQTQDRLNPENTVLDELLRHKHMLLGPARSYLAQYLFRGEDVFKPVRMLSGGERGRLALALLALEGANFLLLDEPTNHLDIPAQEVLQQVLENFEGTILLVSHDRYLIDRLATQIWELHEGWLHVFSGTYAAYMAERENAAQAAKVNAAEQRALDRRGQNEDRQGKYDAKRRERAVAEVEATIHKLEQKLAKIEHDLQVASHAQDLERIQQLSAAYSQTQASLERSMESWAELAA